MACLVLLANLPGQVVLRLRRHEDSDVYPYDEHGRPFVYLIRKFPIRESREETTLPV